MPGELRALGLAVFPPRARADASPFRFLIIDDPVHAMDPAKVDGLAHVLADHAHDRQVTVFTHDNRLPEAVRRLGIKATIWEVTRREGSVVEPRKNLDPVRRHLDEANAVAHQRPARGIDRLLEALRGGKKSTGWRPDPKMTWAPPSRIFAVDKRKA